jgi:hypothetical protein
MQLLGCTNLFSAIIFYALLQLHLYPSVAVCDATGAQLKSSRPVNKNSLDIRFDKQTNFRQIDKNNGQLPKRSECTIDGLTKGNAEPPIFYQ